MNDGFCLFVFLSLSLPFFLSLLSLSLSAALHLAATCNLRIRNVCLTQSDLDVQSLMKRNEKESNENAR